jgi:hypothetical protein
MGRPVELSEEAVRAAAEGRSEQVLGPRSPIKLSEEEVRAAAEGRSEQVLKPKAEDS